MSNLSISFLAALSLVLLVSGCARDPRMDTRTQYIGAVGVSNSPKRASFDNVSYWDGEGVSGAPSVLISLSGKRAYFYKGNELVGVSLISTGREGLETPSGKFKIIQKDKDHKSSQFGDYVDSQGQVIKKDIDVKVDPKPPGAFFYADRRRNRNACRVLAWVSGFPRVHSHARIHGRGVFPESFNRYAGHH